MRTIPFVGKEVSIIIPVFEPLYLITDCLTTFASYTNFEGIVPELVIIDNSHTGAWPIVAKLNPLFTKQGIKVSYQKTRSNNLHVASVNLGLEMSHREWLLFFNDDLEIPPSQPDWLNRLFKTFDEVETCGIATLTLLHRDHSIYWIGNGQDSEHISLYEPYDFIGKPMYFGSPWSNLACAMVRRSTLKKVPFDGIDPKTGKKHTHYIADHHFGRKVKALGLENVVCRDTWIYHHNERKQPQAKRKK